MKFQVQWFYRTRCGQLKDRVEIIEASNSVEAKLIANQMFDLKGNVQARPVKHNDRKPDSRRFGHKSKFEEDMFLMA